MQLAKKLCSEPKKCSKQRKNYAASEGKNYAAREGKNSAASKENNYAGSEEKIMHRAKSYASP